MISLKKISFATIILITLFLSPSRIAEDANPPTHVPEVVVVPVIQKVPPILEHIALCESGGHQFNDDGTIHRGVQNPKDLGKFQINEFWNGEEAKRLGFDLYTLEGNTKMALYMYQHQGTTPWNWSKPCWGKYISE